MLRYLWHIHCFRSTIMPPTWSLCRFCCNWHLYHLHHCPQNYFTTILPSTLLLTLTLPTLSLLLPPSTKQNYCYQLWSTFRSIIHQSPHHHWCINIPQFSTIYHWRQLLFLLQSLMKLLHTIKVINGLCCLSSGRSNFTSVIFITRTFTSDYSVPTLFLAFIHWHHYKTICSISLPLDSISIIMYCVSSNISICSRRFATSAS